MSNIKKMITQNKENNKKRKNLSRIFHVSRALCLILILLAISGCSEQKDSAAIGADITASDTGLTAADTDSDTSTSGDAQIIEEGGSLIIAVSELSETAQFYPVEVDGTRMEVIAVKDSDGNIRTAFNTCQICYSSGRGYYVQDGDVLVCQNCGNRFTVDQIEIESGGCNPWPIFEENKTVTEDSIEISYDFLNESKNIFANWKSSY